MARYKNPLVAPFAKCNVLLMHLVHRSEVLYFVFRSMQLWRLSSITSIRSTITPSERRYPLLGFSKLFLKIANKLGERR